ncbi:hypothetical protein V1508DRAFT_402899 [Lipomyces doorenjongii]|uniref:uncharacterized protein n=1 Tax=Lipomyces doorenjongii TaxID=383834 RepID=UPI0034CE8CC8
MHEQLQVQKIKMSISSQGPPSSRSSGQGKVDWFWGCPEGWFRCARFSVAYDRPLARFAYLVRDRLQIMQSGAMQYGRGINIHMKPPSGDHETGQREFLVQDPDGSLLRFAEDLGTRMHTKDC